MLRRRRRMQPRPRQYADDLPGQHYGLAEMDQWSEHALLHAAPVSA
jgi:hypothetical protein